MIYYDMPFEEYLSHPAINRGLLHTVYSDTPLDAKENLENPEDPTPDMILGTNLHTAVLEPERWQREREVLKVGRRTKTFAEFEKANPDKTPVTVDEDEKINRMRDAVHADTRFQEMMKSARTEVTVIVEDFLGCGLPAKARLDITAGQVFGDLKSTYSTNMLSLADSFERYGYFIQAPFYVDVAAAAGLDPQFFLFLFVEKSPPWKTRWCEPDKIDMAIGRAAYRSAIETWKQCLDSGIYPGNSTAIHKLTMSTFKKRLHDERTNALQSLRW